MADNLDHLAWSRLELEPPTRPRAVLGGPRPPLRSDPATHGGQLAAETEAALDATRARRRASGVDPARLLILRTRLVGPDQRDYLGRLGVQVLGEREERRPLAQPLYEVGIRFERRQIRDAFLEHADRTGLGIVAVEDQRGPGGEVDPLRLAVRFADRERAKAFERPDRAGCPFPFEVQSKRRKLSETVQHVLTLQFEDEGAQRRFLEELAARRRGDADGGALTATQRAALFDGLEGVEQPTREDRQGYRLRTEGHPQGTQFYLDVDLWHPGTHSLVREATDQFRAVVERAGGRVTSRVVPLLNTLLIARVLAAPETLEALLDYDRVSRVDLPPLLEPVRYTVLDQEPAVAEQVTIPDDGPLACLVDSGVVAGHPLLRAGVVVDERDFGSGERTPVDKVGHGTHLAGVVVYGDVHACLQSGEPWRPRVRLLSAKVLRRIEEGFDGELVRPGFQEARRAEEQLEEAITTFARERRCRVFNLSLGNPALRLGHGHQLPWALLLDKLARDLDVVIVVSAGNVPCPDIPAAPSLDGFQECVRERLFTDEHALIDPASAVNALTVGAISRQEVPHDSTGDVGGRPDLTGAPKDCPAPFTRTGLVAGKGAGPCRAIKPELVAYGGNLSLPSHGRGWRDNDPVLAEPSLYFDFNTRALCVACGTSVAAPYVTHVCALVEHRLRELHGTRPFGANLVRALAVHSVEIPAAARDWVRRGRRGAPAARRELRALGFGRPDPYRACFSDHNRAVLIAEAELEERHFHLYRFELPEDFLDRGGRRCVRVTLALDPPVRGTRQEYLSRAMTMQLFRGASTEEICRAAARLEGDAAAIKLPARHKRLKPTVYEWSTAQTAACRGRDRRTFECLKDPPEFRRRWHVLVGCKHRFVTEETARRQRYALVVSLEHSDGQVRLYQALRQQIQQQIEQRATVRVRQ